MPVNVQATIEPYNDTYDVVNAKHVGVGEGENKKKLSDFLNNLPSGTATAPHIGDNGNWFIGDTDTGVKAAGENGKDGVDGKDGANGTNGKDGVTPHIGANGNWFIGDTDTGVAAGGNGGGEYAIPTFNLAELGLSAVVPGGDIVAVETDTTEIAAALDKGAVKFIALFNMGMEISTALVLNPAAVLASGEYSCTAINEFNGTFLITTVNVANGFIAAKCTLMDNIVGGTAQPTAIDLSGLETNGTIVETYADGTTNTTSIEFDANGTPTKITDGDGNVTTLTW